MYKKWLIIALILLFFFVSVLSSVRLNDFKMSNQILRDENLKLKQSMERLQLNFDDTQERISALESWFEDYQGLSENLRSVLVENGHMDPETYILQQLAEREDLIRSEAVLGGSFFIVTVKIIKDGLAFIEFEDGHIQGYFIAAFSYHAETDELDVESVFEVLN